MKTYSKWHWYQKKYQKEVPILVKNSSFNFGIATAELQIPKSKNRNGTDTCGLNHFLGWHLKGTHMDWKEVRSVEEFLLIVQNLQQYLNMTVFQLVILDKAIEPNLERT